MENLSLLRQLPEWLQPWTLKWSVRDKHPVLLSLTPDGQRESITLELKVMQVSSNIGPWAIPPTEQCTIFWWETSLQTNRATHPNTPHSPLLTPAHHGFSPVSLSTSLPTWWNPSTSQGLVPMSPSSWNLPASLAKNSTLWLLAPKMLHLCLCPTLGICFHMLCSVFSPFLSLKHSGVRNYLTHPL